MISAGVLQELAEAGLAAATHPLYPGVVLGVDQAGRRELVYAGEALRYDADGLLPPDRRVPVTADTVFDLASLTKLVVSLVAVGELDDLDAPAFRTVTARQLLTHSSGLPAEPDRPPADVLTVEPVAAPGTTVVYSCTGFLVLQRLLERTTGQPLDALVRARISRPLGLGLSYLPRYAGVPVERIAATEVRPGQPDSRGLVHDENAAALGGVAGNAGLFGTATDLLDLGRAVLDALAGRRAFPGVRPDRLRETVSPQAVPGPVPYASGLGFRIDDAGFMGELAGGGRAYGHTGFTGTSLVLDEARDLVVTILTNRVHPSRTWSDLHPYRRRVHTAVRNLS